jgi:hypothetical protein
MTWLDFLTPLPETYLNTSFCLMTASLQNIWSTTLKTCARHGIISSPCKPYSNKFKIMWITQEREESPSAKRRSRPLHTPRSSPQTTSIVPAAVGIKDIPNTRLGTTSISILRWPTISTSKCRVNQRLLPGMPMLL